VTSLYIWLRFLHLTGLGAFLFGHGISAGCSSALRGRPSPAVARAYLGLSQWSYRITYPGLLLLLVTGVGMAFAGHRWGSGWIWAAIVVLVAVSVAMGALSAPYHRARDATDDVVLERELARSRPGLTSWVGAVGLLLLILLMVVKPF